MPDVYRFHGFTFDAAAGALEGPLGAIQLRPKALALLQLLVRGAGKTLSKDEILHEVWPGVTVTDETLTQTIHELRRSLGEDAQTLIRTVPRRGYVFSANALVVAPRGNRTLVVVPFLNLSADTEQSFFATGLVLDLESALGLIDGIELRADPREAEFELTGSVRAVAGQIRVTARLTDRAVGRQLWSGRFDGQADGIFALQDEITRKVAVAMQVELTTGDSARLWGGRTASLAAWERYVIGSRHYLRWTEADNSRARDLLIEALAIDANYVAAKVMLAKTWWYDARFFTDGEERRHAIAEAERLAREVLEQSPDAANAMMTLGGTAWLRDEHDEAVEYCRRAADQSPSDAFVLGFLGMILIFRGNLDEALVVLGRAERLSPQAIAWVAFHIAHARAWTGDDSGALAKINSYIAAAPHEPFGQVMLAVVHGFAGRMPAARSAVAEALLLEPDLDQHQVSRSHRYRDPGRLEKMIAVLNEAGLPA